MNDALLKFAEAEDTFVPQVPYRSERLDKSGIAGQYARGRVQDLSGYDPDVIADQTYGENIVKKTIRRHPMLMTAGGYLAGKKVGNLIGSHKRLAKLTGALGGYTASRLAGSKDTRYQVMDKVRKETGNMYSGWDF